MTKDQKRILELEEEIKVLKSRLRKVNEELSRWRKLDSKRYREERDYLPYDYDD